MANLKNAIFYVVSVGCLLSSTAAGDSKYGYPDELALIDPYDHISIAFPEDIQEKHEVLNRYFWGSPEVPHSKQPQSTYEVYRKEGNSALPSELSKISIENVHRVTKVIVEVDYEYRHTSFFITPVLPTQKPRLAIVHQGHQGGLKDGIDWVTDTLLDRGFYVMLMQMPLVGWNKCNRWVLPDREIQIPERGTAGHDEMIASLEGLDGSPLKYFVEPVIVGVNHFINMFPGYKSIVMIGLSGGGWTTHLAGAIDTRINLTIAVAGSYPLYVRPYYKGSRGDAEQYLPQLYKERASYLDLYIMSSVGRARKHVQLLNKYDSCCFYGLGVKSYQAAIEEIVDENDGEWSAVLDTTHQSHRISLWAINNVIVPNLEHFTTPTISRIVHVNKSGSRRSVRLSLFNNQKNAYIYLVDGRRIAGSAVTRGNLSRIPVIAVTNSE